MPRRNIEQIGAKYYYKIDVATGCWIGTPIPNKEGYCTIKINCRSYDLHRYMYEKYFGKIPRGYELHHTCRSKRCCNIFHLKVMKTGEHQSMHLKERNGNWH